VVTSLLVALFAAEPALAQKQGGILKMYNPNSPASMSIHEEATIVSERPMMGVFNNLVMFDQHVKQNSLLETFAANSIVKILAGSFAGRTGRVVASGAKATRLSIQAFGGRSTLLTVTTADLAAVAE
jgi:hypothetical protein